VYVTDDRLERARELILYFIVGEMKDAISLSPQLLLADKVIFMLTVMDWSIDFDNQFQTYAEEIGDEGTQRHLPAEFITMKAATSQFFPENPLFRSHAPTQLTGEADFPLSNSMGLFCFKHKWASVASDIQKQNIPSPTRMTFISAHGCSEII
jgi:hypothetical protein